VLCVRSSTKVSGLTPTAVFVSVWIWYQLVSEQSSACPVEIDQVGGHVAYCAACNCLKKVVLSMARFRLCSHNLRIETGRHEGLPRNERSCRRCKGQLGEDFVAPIDDEKHLVFSCETTKDTMVALGWPAHVRRFDAV
jgi:hypothetical protein